MGFWAVPTPTSEPHFTQKLPGARCPGLCGFRCMGGGLCPHPPPNRISRRSLLAPESLRFSVSGPGPRRTVRLPSSQEASRRMLCGLLRTSCQAAACHPRARAGQPEYMRLPARPVRRVRSFPSDKKGPFPVFAGPDRTSCRRAAQCRSPCRRAPPRGGGLIAVSDHRFNQTGFCTVSCARPRARRRARTLRPFLVAIRARKPCTFARWRFLG